MRSKSIFSSAFIITALFMGSCSSEETVTKEENFLPLVKLAPALEKPFEHKITVQGNVETEKDVLLNSEMGGLVTTVHVKSGERVSSGQVLVTLDASMLSSSAEELKTQMEYAQYMLDKQSELKKRGVGSDFDYKTALNQVNSLKSKMNSLNVQRGKMQIKAPFSGVIDLVYAKQGQMTGPQAPLVRLVNNQSVDITASISEKHLSKITIGSEIEVTFPNFKDTTVSLKVTNVGNYIEPTNRTFRIISTINNNKIFLPNMLAQINITDLHVANGLVIPSKSLLKAQDNSEYIFVANSKGNNEFTVKKVTVKVIERYNGEALIESTSEIKDGTQIIVEGARGITAKDIVRSK